MDTSFLNMTIPKFINHFNWKNPFTGEQIRSEQDLFIAQEMARLVDSGYFAPETVSPKDVDISKFVPAKSLDDFITSLNWTNPDTGERILTFDDYNEYLAAGVKEKYSKAAQSSQVQSNSKPENNTVQSQNINETQTSPNTEVSVSKVVLSFILGTAAFGIIIYLFRVLVWGKIFAGVISWLFSLNTSSLIIAIAILPFGSLAVYIGIFIPIYLIIKSVGKILFIVNKNNEKNKNSALVGIGTFHMAFAVYGFIFYILIVMNNPLSYYVFIGFGAALLEFIVGIMLRRSGKNIDTSLDELLNK